MTLMVIPMLKTKVLSYRPPTRDTSTQSRKFNKKKNYDEELLHEESTFITPRPPTPPAEKQTKKALPFIPSPLMMFRKRKPAEPLLSPKLTKIKEISPRSFFGFALSLGIN